MLSHSTSACLCNEIRERSNSGRRKRYPSAHQRRHRNYRQHSAENRSRSGSERPCLSEPATCWVERGWQQALEDTYRLNSEPHKISQSMRSDRLRQTDK